MNVPNFGSLNIDFVYKVPHIVRPGETLSSGRLTVNASSKGANQSCTASALTVSKPGAMDAIPLAADVELS